MTKARKAKGIIDCISTMYQSILHIWSVPCLSDSIYSQSTFACSTSVIKSLELNDILLSLLVKPPAYFIFFRDVRWGRAYPYSTYFRYVEGEFDTNTPRADAAIGMRIQESPRDLQGKQVMGPPPAPLCMSPSMCVCVVEERFLAHQLNCSSSTNLEFPTCTGGHSIVVEWSDRPKSMLILNGNSHMRDDRPRGL